MSSTTKKIILGDTFKPSTTKKIKSTYKDELENKVEILLTTYRGIKEKINNSKDFHNNYESSEHTVDGRFVCDTLINFCGISCNALENIMFTMRQKNTMKFCFSRLITHPYDFIDEDFYLITHERAETINEKFKLNIPYEIRCEKWILFYILEDQKCFWILKHEFDLAFFRYCRSVRSPVLEEVKKSVCIERDFYGETYVSTKYLIEIEKDMGDAMIELYDDSEEEKLSNFNLEMFNKFIAGYQIQKSITFTDEQKNAIISCVKNRFNIVCGYPGTGKTTITEAACSYSHSYNPKINICLTSHTGLATKNLKSAIDRKYYKNKLVGTITKLIYSIFPQIRESLLNTGVYSMESQEMYKNLKPDLIVVDEMSMVDMILFNSLLKWCKYFNCRLILLGDEKQLPPIGPGNTLQTFVDAFNDPKQIQFNVSFNVSYLTVIKRQDTGVLKDNIMNMSKRTLKPSDFDQDSMIFLEEKDFINVKTNNLDSSKFRKFLKKYNLTTGNTHFVAAQKTKEFSCIHINNVLQKYFNPIGSTTQQIENNKRTRYKPTFTFHEKDKVIRLKNYYDSKEDTFYANGDTGTVHLVHNPNGSTKIKIRYDDGQVQIISFFELYEDFIPFYCNTIHKSQGSQYDNIVIFIPSAHEWMLTQEGAWNLVYTAISRARKRCFVIGNSKLFQIAQHYKIKKNPTVFLREFNEFELSEESEEQEEY